MSILTFLFCDRGWLHSLFTPPLSILGGTASSEDDHSPKTRQMVDVILLKNILERQEHTGFGRLGRISHMYAADEGKGRCQLGGSCRRIDAD